MSTRQRRALFVPFASSRNHLTCFWVSSCSEALPSQAGRAHQQLNPWLHPANIWIFCPLCTPLLSLALPHTVQEPQPLGTRGTDCLLGGAQQLCVLPAQCSSLGAASRQELGSGLPFSQDPFLQTAEPEGFCLVDFVSCLFTMGGQFL